jgi:hypothetical protein
VLRDAQVSGVRAVQPVVRRAEPEQAVKAPLQATTYTPQTTSQESQPLYSRRGTPAASSAVFTSASYDRQDFFDLQVQTAEGDVASLRFSQSSAGAVSTADVRSASGNSQALTFNATQDTDMRVSVKGSLDDKERASINALADKVRSVADDFFAGNMDGALRSASRIDISKQGDSLSAYAFSLETRETRMAAAIYEDVAKSAGPLNVQLQLAGPTPAAAPPPEPAPVEPVTKGLLKELLALFDRLTGTDQAPARPASPA